MKVRLDPSDAAPILRTMPPDARRRMRAALRSLADDPSGTSGGLDLKRLRLSGDPPIFRLRIASWRACWMLRPGSVDVLRIFHRREGYAWIERQYPANTQASTRTSGRSPRR